MPVNRNYKDSVFTRLFSDPDLLRELYCAIGGVSLSPDVPVSINTLEREKTINEAVKFCHKHDILSEFLEIHGEEAPGNAPREAVKMKKFNMAWRSEEFLISIMREDFSPSRSGRASCRERV